MSTGLSWCQHEQRKWSGCSVCDAMSDPERVEMLRGLLKQFQEAVRIGRPVERIRDSKRASPRLTLIRGGLDGEV